MLKSCLIDICLQEFKGNGAKVVCNKYKLLQSECSKSESGVDNIVVNCFVEMKVEVGRPSDIILKTKVVIENEVWEVVSCYYPEVGRPTVGTDEFYEPLD